MAHSFVAIIIHSYNSTNMHSAKGFVIGTLESTHNPENVMLSTMESPIYVSSM